MRIAIDSFRGESPRVTPRLLPDNAAQQAVNCRLQTGDLESWRQFLWIKTLASAAPVRAIYLLDGQWLSWSQPVDVARGLIAGDASFRTYLTCTTLYTEPRFTDRSMATTGAEPFPVTTRPLGVAGPDGPPGVVVQDDTNPTTVNHTTAEVCSAESFAKWKLSPGQSETTRKCSKTFFDAAHGVYSSLAQNNEDVPAYATLDFKIANTTHSTFQAQVWFENLGGNRGGDATLLCGVDAMGAGARIGLQGVPGSRLSVYIAVGDEFMSGRGSILAETQVTPWNLAMRTWYTLMADKTLKDDGTATLVVKLRLGDAELATVTATYAFDNGGLCGFICAKGDDLLRLYYGAFHASGAGSTGYVAHNTALSYVYTFVNDLLEEGAPSKPSVSQKRPDGIAVVVTTPTVPPAKAKPGSRITTKRLYRSVTGATGTVFVLLHEGPLAEGPFTDNIKDEDIANADLLESEHWDPPPDDLQGIIALPNGIMAGFRLNQFCLSAAGYPHAWPVRNRLPVDSEIVAIANIDNTIVIGTKSFPYTATGNDPSSYSMSKPGDPQACVSKRSMVFLPDVGVVYASPDGMMVCSGSAGQITNATAGLFTKRQWEELVPSSMFSVVHDGMLFLFSAAGAFVLDTRPTGFGLVRLSFHATAAYADPLSDGLYLVLDSNSEPTDALLPLASSAVATDGRRIHRFDAGAGEMVYRWRGKLNLAPYPLAMTLLQVRALSFANLLVRVYGDGVLVYQKLLSSGAEFTLPALNARQAYELELMGTSTVRGLQLAEDVMELS